MVKRFGVLSALFVLLAVLTSAVVAQDTVTVKLWMHGSTKVEAISYPKYSENVEFLP